jgi:prolipoprotein diacylglyceryltransferase
MILSIVLIVVGLIVVVALFQAKAKNKDSNGPMNNN